MLFTSFYSPASHWLCISFFLSCTVLLHLFKGFKWFEIKIRTPELVFIANPVKHVLKLLSLLVVISALWIGLLQASIIPQSHTWLLPIYFIVSLGCYGLFMVGVGLMRFPTCPQEALLLQQDIAEAKDFLKQKGVDVGSN
ncbi:dolichol-phosphate mannose synthase subunit 3-like isoform X1 [Hibiscus syriacus]|uniref:dolichol-phosphate mannose synthase subunit 3-like isoform X1 n=1 Tax=Hibiscus syriacus TaxID=106335 RepID=UPI001920A6B5|nr:dolichol-phosphate mannose synthase subunit 3-like isoform X1 [Hibiscus syriacus]